MRECGSERASQSSILKYVESDVLCASVLFAICICLCVCVSLSPYHRISASILVRFGWSGTGVPLQPDSQLNITRHRATQVTESCTTAGENGKRRTGTTGQKRTGGRTGKTGCRKRMTNSAAKKPGGVGKSGQTESKQRTRVWGLRV